MSQSRNPDPSDIQATLPPGAVDARPNDVGGQKEKQTHAVGKKTTKGGRTGEEIELWLPQTFSHYHIIKTLGKGGMGIVYEAHDSQLDRHVAIKVPFIQQGGEGGVQLERFYREAKALASLQHPNICPVYAVDELNGVHYMVMAHLEGKLLSKLLEERGRLPVRYSVALIRKLARALDEAHNRGVIHRDLKPDNIMVNKQAEPIVMDFGLARREGKGDQRLTEDGSMMGTPVYMPAEQVNGESKKMGPRSDVYSLGVIFYELLTGQVPYSGSLLEVLAQIAHGNAELPSSIRPRIDSTLDQLCLKAMSKESDDRFQSMSEFADELTAYLKSRQEQKDSTSDDGPNWPELAKMEKAAQAVEKEEVAPTPTDRREVQSTIVQGPAASAAPSTTINQAASPVHADVNRTIVGSQIADEEEIEDEEEDETEEAEEKQGMDPRMLAGIWIVGILVVAALIGQLFMGGGSEPDTKNNSGAGAGSPVAPPNPTPPKPPTEIIESDGQAETIDVNKKGKLDKLE